MPTFEEIVCRYFRFLDARSSAFNAFLGLAWTAIFGALEIFTTGNLTFSFLYLLPIAFSTWFAGKRHGLVIALLCASLWSVNNFVANDLAVSLWNILSTSAIFIAASALLAKIRQLWEKDIALSRTDPLTGVLNSRAFAGLVEYEILRLRRESSPFSLAFLDLDDFKAVNDRYGHKKGDELLKTVVVKIAENLRKTDAIARVGGDEFIIFLPAANLGAAQVVMRKVREQLRALTGSNNWTPTFSIGVVTCDHGVCDLDKIISLADALMYEVKKAGKNDIRFATFE